MAVKWSKDQIFPPNNKTAKTRELKSTIKEAEEEKSQSNNAAKNIQRKKSNFLLRLSENRTIQYKV